MSETEHHRGKLIPTEDKGSLSASMKSILIEMGEEIEPGDSQEDLMDQFWDAAYRMYTIINDKIYKIDDKEIDADEDVYTSTHNADGTIDFEVKFYNGGCSFDEAIEEAVENGRESK